MIVHINLGALPGKCDNPFEDMLHISSCDQ